MPCASSTEVADGLSRRPGQPRSATIQTVNKTATRRASGRSAEELQAAVERFLKVSTRPALLEPGEAIITLAAGNFAIGCRNARVTLQAWDEQRNLVRRILDIEEETRGRMKLLVERFARKQGPLFLIDLDRPAGQDWERRGTRLVFRERFRQYLSREFPPWKLAELSTEADLEHSLSPAYPRAFLKRGASGLAVMAAGPESLNPDGLLSFGLIWLDYLRRRERRITVEGLVLFLPDTEERTTALRARFLNHDAARFEVFVYSSQDQVGRLDLRDAGNLDTKLEVYRRPALDGHPAVDKLLSIAGVERRDTAGGEISLGVRGLEFARTAGNEILFGLGARVPLRETNLDECEHLARELARMRSAVGAHANELYLRDPEAWLESQVRADLETIDASLLTKPVYGQVPAFAGGDRGIIDLLAADTVGRLAVIELKASADLHLPLQALDYWMRVNWHLERDEFSTNGYFPGATLRKVPPRLLLVAPALEFHPSTETVLSYISPAIEIERIGLGTNWRRTLDVMFRLRGAERPV